MRFHDLDGDYGRKAFAEVIAVDFNFGILQQIVVFGVLLERGCKAAAKPGEVGAAFYGVDIVDKRIDCLRVIGVVSQGHFDGYTLAFDVEIDDIAYE